MNTSLKTENQIKASGTGVLHFEKIAERTIVRRAFARTPLRLMNPRNHGHAAWVYSSNFGGGYVDGDHINLKINVGPSAQAVLLTQSATKVYRSTHGASQVLEAQIEKNASLIVLPDFTTCFSGAKFLQKQTITLHEDASLLLIDSLNCGRSDSGERWLFEDFKSQIHITRNERKVFFDSLLLNSSAGKIPQRMGTFNVFSLVLFIGPEFKKYGLEVLNALSQQIPSPNASIILSASPVKDEEGVILRIASETTEALNNQLQKILYFLPKKLGDNVWARKW